MTWTHLAILAGFAFVLGSSIGSFLNVVIHRLPRGESLVRPPSRCPRCGSKIAARDNVPVLGWLLLRGRCRCCAAPISARYPLVEATTGLAFTLAALLATAGSHSLFDRDPVAAVVRVVSHSHAR
jgi:leader peptidase (prepilin peptidase)/N-methyltransferase